MMRLYTLKLFFLCLCAGCAAHTPPSLESPQAPTETITVYDYVFAMTKPTQRRVLEYQDEKLLCRLQPRELEIGIDIINLSETPFVIEWDQVRLIDPNGVSHPVLHNPVLLPDISRRQTPALVLPQGVLSDTVAPKTFVFFEASTWRQRPIFPNTEEAMRLRDATFGVVIPVKTGADVQIYTFEFQVQDVQRHSIVKK